MKATTSEIFIGRPTLERRAGDAGAKRCGAPPFTYGRAGEDAKAVADTAQPRMVLVAARAGLLRLQPGLPWDDTVRAYEQMSWASLAGRARRRAAAASFAWMLGWRAFLAGLGSPLPLRAAVPHLVHLASSASTSRARCGRWSPRWSSPASTRCRGRAAQRDAAGGGDDDRVRVAVAAADVAADVRGGPRPLLVAVPAGARPDRRPASADRDLVPRTRAPARPAAPAGASGEPGHDAARRRLDGARLGAVRRAPVAAVRAAGGEVAGFRSSPPARTRWRSPRVSSSSSRRAASGCVRRRSRAVLEPVLACGRPAGRRDRLPGRDDRRRPRGRGSRGPAGRSARGGGGDRGRRGRGGDPADAVAEASLRQPGSSPAYDDRAAARAGMYARFRNSEYAADQGVTVHCPFTVTDATSTSRSWRARRPCWSTSGRTGAGPCRMIAPMLDQIAAEYAGKIKIAKIDYDGNPDAAASTACWACRPCCCSRTARSSSRSSGAKPKRALLKVIEPHL